jgi:hypothetical protein
MKTPINTTSATRVRKDYEIAMLSSMGRTSEHPYFTGKLNKNQ